MPVASIRASGGVISIVIVVGSDAPAVVAVVIMAAVIVEVDIVDVIIIVAVVAVTMGPKKSLSYAINTGFWTSPIPSTNIDRHESTVALVFVKGAPYLFYQSPQNFPRIF